MKASTRVMSRRHVYWADVAQSVVEWVGAVAVVYYVVMLVLDTMFPNIPL